MYRIGIDVGGTFTDLVAIDASGATTLEKVPSTPQDPSLGVLEGLEHLAQRLGLDRTTLLAQTDRIVHGTTVATNALLERKGARLGLLTTEGHRDVIEMREGLKDDRYNLRMPPPEQLVPRRLRLGVRERMRADGRVETPLDPASLDAAIAVLQQERVEAVAVCYLHAWRDRATSRKPPWRCAARCPTPMFRYPLRSCRRSRNSSGSRRQSSTPMSARCWRAIWPGSKPGSPIPAIRGRR